MKHRWKTSKTDRKSERWANRQRTKRNTDDQKRGNRQQMATYKPIDRNRPQRASEATE